MSSIKCPECGFFSYAGLNACKRCNTPFARSESGALAQSQPKRAAKTVKLEARQARAARRTPSIQPALANIVKNDYVLMLAVLSVAALWILFAAINLLGMLFGSAEAAVPIKGVPAPPPDQTLFYLTIAGTAFGAAFAAWRIYFFRQIFASGNETIGRITNVSFSPDAAKKTGGYVKKIPLFKDAGRVEYVYTVNGRDYKSGNAVKKNDTTDSFQQGDEIELVVDRSNPYRAFIKTLYT